MDHVLPVKCNPAQPPTPINVGAYPVSDKIIFVVWDKPLGDGKLIWKLFGQGKFNNHSFTVPMKVL